MYNAANNEENLLRGLSVGERNATEKIYNRHFHVVNSWLLKQGCSSDDAADLFQEAMVVLYEKSLNHEFRLTCNIGTYLFAISKNLWYKKLQKPQADGYRLPENMDDEGDIHGFEDDVSAHHERENYYKKLDVALEQLGEPCRSLIQAYYHRDKSMSQIAAEFGYTNPENAKTQKYKCLTRLRKLFYGVQA